MTNREIANILYEMAMFFEMEGAAFKPAAYERAGQSIESLDTELAGLYREKGRNAFADIPGVGKGIADHLKELLEKGDFREHAALVKKYPVKIAELAAVQGVGPKMIKLLWQKLKIKNLADLERAAKAGKIRTLPGLGEKSEQKILKGIEFLKTSGGRKLLGSILPEVRTLESLVRSFPETEEAAVAGSIRRRKETIGDIDILVASSQPEAVMQKFLALPIISHVYGHGQTKTNVRLKNGLDADLRVVPKKSWGAALNYFTGSKEHNVALRERAIKKGWKLNEYGLFSAKGGQAGAKMVAGKTEEELYKKLGLRYIEPELRENMGEIEAARMNKLPHLIGYGDIRGDLQVQTDWTDGDNSIEEMALAASDAGLEYIAITDHTQYLAMTRGLDEKKVIKQMAEIDRVNKKLRGRAITCHVLKGTECDIHKDGSLDLTDDVLSKLDVVGVSIHSYFKLSREEQTKRVIRAMENPHVDIVFHLTGRLINKRPPVDVDIDAIIAAAKRTGTVLEINASPERLDLKDEYIRKCVEAGVKMTIDSDAHAADHFTFLEYGIAQARRGWATKNDIINTRPLKDFLQALK
ncbi:MAG: DNA polymerase/3'-5' exonuclease PolX [Candidatus Sungbacteria bacterium]|nr:DNA polymerase/3'-5' exonuclease PolX [Candidatus Sungbacteria bacterium]